MAKLGLLIIVSGILPLSAVAGWWVWQMVERADFLVAQANKDVAREIRNEMDSHSLLLRLYASELDRVGRTDEETKTLLQQWSMIPGTFSSLQIVDLSEVESRMSPSVRDAFKSSSIAFYNLPDPNSPGEEHIWGATPIGSTGSRVLTGYCEWRADLPLSAQWAGHEVVIVYHANGTELYRRTPPELADWKPAADSSGTTPYKVRHGGKTWHVAESFSRIQDVRYITATSANTWGRTATSPGKTNSLNALPANAEAPLHISTRTYRFCHNGRL